MRRKAKNLPSDRSRWTFGDLVYWHFFIFGTRPNLAPDATAGRIWEPKRAAGALGKTERGLSNWVENRHPPYDTIPLEKALFGDSPHFDAQRRELRTALRQQRHLNAAMAAGAGTPPDPLQSSGNLPPVIDTTGHKEDDEEPEPSPGRTLVSLQPRPHSENNGNTDTDQRYRAKLFPFQIDVSRQAGPLGRRRFHLRPWMVPAGLIALGAIYASIRWPGSPPESEISPKPTQPSPTVRADDPKRTAALPVTLPKETPQPPQAAAAPSLQPPRAPAPIAAPSAPPAGGDKSAAAAKRKEQEQIAAREKAYDAERKRAEELAGRLDQDDHADAGNKQVAEARTIAGLRFRLHPYTGVSSGVSLGHVLSPSAPDCARSCKEVGCDAFAYFSEQPVSEGAGRYCYRYAKPFTFESHGTYTAGERIGGEYAGEAAPVPEPAAAQEVGDDLMPAGSAAPSATQANGIVDCPTGPVKVSGFKINCNAILSGGTTLGSARLSYSLPNINQCAEKCRPIAGCVGFTFRASGTGANHSCVLFGPSPLIRQSNGWVSGSR